jgi:hypothetical protein
MTVAPLKPAPAFFLLLSSCAVLLLVPFQQALATTQAGSNGAILQAGDTSLVVDSHHKGAKSPQNAILQYANYRGWRLGNT